MTRRGLLYSLATLAFVGVFAFAGCTEEDGGGDTGSTTQAVTHDVSIEGFAFSPAALTIAVGDTVRWTNADSTPHTATSGAPGDETGVFDSDNLDNGGVFSHTFTGAGDFAYFCRVHPGMRGNVTVE